MNTVKIKEEISKKESQTTTKAPKQDWTDERSEKTCKEV